MKYDIQKRIFLVKKYNEFQSFALVQCAYMYAHYIWTCRSKYKNETTPSNNKILIIWSQFSKKQDQLHLLHIKKKFSGGKWKVAKNEMENLISKFPSLSIRKAASAVGVFITLVFSILHSDLHLKPYKFHQWHKLEARSHIKLYCFRKLRSQSLYWYNPSNFFFPRKYKGIRMKHKKWFTRKSEKIWCDVHFNFSFWWFPCISFFIFLYIFIFPFDFLKFPFFVP